MTPSVAQAVLVQQEKTEFIEISIVLCPSVFQEGFVIIKLTICGVKNIEIIPLFGYTKKE